MKKKTATQSNAERRLARKEMQADDLREQDMNAIIKNVSVDEPAVEVFFLKRVCVKLFPQDLNLENDIRTNPSILKKRIKKIQRKTGEDKLKVTMKEQERAKSKVKKELFNGVNERKKRRV